MSIELESLRRKVESLESKLMDAQIDLNMKDTRIRELENDLAEARAQIREYEVGTQTMRKLRILGESEDDTGFDPRDSGVFHTDAWKGVR